MSQSVTVIIPAFNRAHCLPRALDSVLAQTRVPDQILLVDDGSSDGTRELVSHQYPAVDYIYQDNGGVSAARNRGIAASEHDWIAFLDSDDEWLPTKLEQQLKAAGSAPDPQLIHCDEIWIRRGRRVNAMAKHRKRGGYIFKYCLALCLISPSAVMMRRSLLNQFGGFDESLPACEDYDLWLRICAGHEVLYLDTPLLKKYGGHPDQLSQKYWGMDRFRVQSLASLLESDLLDRNQQRLVRDTLLEKCQVLIQGAEKRANREVAEHYLSISERYSESPIRALGP